MPCQTAPVDGEQAGEQGPFSLDVGWSTIPVLDLLYPQHMDAYNRCGLLNPDLPDRRKQALKATVTTQA